MLYVKTKLMYGIETINSNLFDSNKQTLCNIAQTSTSLYHHGIFVSYRNKFVR